MDRHSSHGRSVALATDLIDAVRAGLDGEPEAAGLADRALADLRCHGSAGPATHPEIVALIETGKGEWLLRAGQPGRARSALSAGLRAARTAGVPSLMARCLAPLAVIAALRGELRRATDLASEAVTRGAVPATLPPDRVPLAEAELALAWVSTEQHDLLGAEEHLRAASRTSPVREDPLQVTLAALVEGRLLHAGGRTGKAIDLLDRAGAVVTGEWLRRHLVVEGAALRVAQGDAETALRSIDDLGNASIDCVLVRSTAQLALGRVSDSRDSVAAFEDRRDSLPLPVQARGGILQAALELQRREPGQAKAVLLRILRAAAPELLRRPFVEAPAPVRELIASDPDLVEHGPWLGSDGRSRPSVVPLQRSAPTTRPGDAPPPGQVIEPLTAKEHEVLGLLSELLSTEEIAAAMFVSVNTIRTHVRSILRKLAVSRRNEAVRRARALGLIAT